MPNEFLRDRIARKLASLPDERLYQVLDFVEFLETKYAEPTPATTANLFQRFAEGVEDRLRAGKVSAGTIAETMNLMHRAVKVLDGVTTAGQKVATDIAGVAKGIVTTPPRGTGGASGAAAGGTGEAGEPGSGTSPASPSSGNTQPGTTPPGSTPPGSTPPSTGGSNG